MKENDRFNELDVVRLMQPVPADHPAARSAQHFEAPLDEGDQGTIVMVYPSLPNGSRAYEVEFVYGADSSEKRGYSRALLSLPHEVLELVWRSK